jgi:hypothetical protein
LDNEPYPPEEHTARNADTAFSSIYGSQVQHSSEKATGHTLHRVAATQEGCVHQRLFLAPTSTMLTRNDPKDKPKLLGAEADAQCRERQRDKEAVAQARLVCHNALGMPAKERQQEAGLPE